MLMLCSKKGVITIRVFIAIGFSRDLKELLWHYSGRLQKESLKGNFTRQDNFHLTLRFIGEVKGERLDKLKEAIDQVCHAREEFHLSLDVLGQFVRGSKSIVWLGLKENKFLEGLHQDLDQTLEEIGLEREERSFQPHITLGREILLKNEFSELQKRLKVEPYDFRVNQVSLMESTRIDGKLTYRPIYIKDFFV